MSKDILYNMKSQGLIAPKDYVLDNLCLLSFGGSISYGVSTPESDTDLIGFYVPPTDHIYQPGIYGFDKPNIADVFTAQHIMFEGMSYDITLYPIQQIFKLAYDGNPNIIDFLVSDRKYVVYFNLIGFKVIDNARLFLSKKCVARYLGFSTSELSTIKKGMDKYSGLKHLDDIELKKDLPRYGLYRKYGYDVKAAGNMIRLCCSLDVLLKVGYYCPSDYNEDIRSVRNGEYSFDDLSRLVLAFKEEVKNKEEESSLVDEPNLTEVRNVLEDCIDIFIRWENDRLKGRLFKKGRDN